MVYSAMRKSVLFSKTSKTTSLMINRLFEGIILSQTEETKGKDESDMLLYRLIFQCPKDFVEKIRQEEQDRMRSGCRYQGTMLSLNTKFENHYNNDRRMRAVISGMTGNQLTVVVACEADKIELASCVNYIGSVIPGAKFKKKTELTIEDFQREVQYANDRTWIGCEGEDLVDRLGLNIRAKRYLLTEGAMYKIEETICTGEDINKELSFAQLSDIMASDNFREEMERIYSDENEKKFYGHPVHYLVTAGEKKAAQEMIKILVSALVKNKRLLGGRVCSMYDLAGTAYRDEGFDVLFNAMKGGTVVVYLSIYQDTSRVKEYSGLMERFASKMETYGNDILFIFVDVSSQRNIADDAVAMMLKNADVVSIDEGHGDLEDAKAYLKRLAGKTVYKDYSTSDLDVFLPKDKVEYTASDVYQAYNHWYGKGLKTHVYKAYKEQDVVRLAVKNKPRTPYEELQKMIGLTEVKMVVDELCATARLKRTRKRFGIVDENFTMHMLFSGNPGTAKTTVGRLLAQILKNEEVIKRGQLVECGRQDLVGKYVGWTAKNVEEKFRSARGGVLFIDEAYALVEDGNTYGAEAINTIVQMMENFRDDVVVIFAGYPEKMKQFLDKNEGLRSRIAFHMNFPDYNTDELLDIMKRMLEQRQFRLEGQVAERKCRSIFETASKEAEFGNGRFVRNLLEHAIMRQANRLYGGADNDKEISKEEAMTLLADDFEMIGMKKERKTMGFATV